MAIQYRISRRKNNIATNAETNYILQAVSTGEIDIERLSYEISTESTLKIGFKSVAQPNKSLLRTAEVSKFHINYQPSVKLKRWLKKGIALKKEKTKK